MSLEPEPKAVTEMPPPALDPDCPSCTHPWAEHDGAKCIRGITRNGAPVSPSCRRCRANLESLGTMRVTEDATVEKLIDSMFDPKMADLPDWLNPKMEAGPLTLEALMKATRSAGSYRLGDYEMPLRTADWVQPGTFFILPNAMIDVAGDPRNGPMYIDGERIDP